MERTNARAGRVPKDGVADEERELRRASDMTSVERSHAPSEIQRRLAVRSRRILLLAVIVVVLPAPSAHARDLVVNGALTTGTGDRPNAWKIDLWSPSKGTAFEWRKGAAGAPGVLVVRNPQPNDARWIQEVPVEPDQWYRLSGFVRAIGVSEEGVGASLSLMRGFDHSEALSGDRDWTPVSMWFKTRGEHTVKIACRLGSFGQISSGEAWCTGIRLEAQARPPLNADYVYGPLEESTAPVGVPTAVGLLLLLVYGVVQHGRTGRGASTAEKLGLAGVLLAVLAAKIIAAPYFQYKADVATYSAWAIRLATEGPARFYAPNYFADYPPGYMYVLWGVGSIAKATGIPYGSAPFLILLKLPALLADAAVSWLLWVRLRGSGKKLAWTACLAFALNPALLLNSAVWGQTDSVLALLLLLALFEQAERRFELA